MILRTLYNHKIVNLFELTVGTKDSKPTLELKFTRKSCRKLQYPCNLKLKHGLELHIIIHLYNNLHFVRISCIVMFL
jgi:hypothetical protein